jgi:hypothetical protein
MNIILFGCSLHMFQTIIFCVGFAERIEQNKLESTEKL